MPRLVRLSEPPGSVDDLRGSWARRSVETGWAFPSDWHSPSVDAVCEALTERRDVRPAGERLGRERASAGVSLAETLTDIDALAEAVPGCAEALRRAVSLGWADRAAAPADAVSDALTGLASSDYLRIRLGEVYRAADVEGSSAGETHALVLVRLGRAGAPGWAQNLPMILVGDAMRTVFAGGQSLARIGPLVAVVLAHRTPVLARQARVLAELLAARIRVGSDPGLLPQVWIESLPPGWQAANALVAELGR
jgi:hypothetical protein